MCARQLKAITLFAGGGLYHLHFAAAWPMRSYRVLLYNGHSFLPCRICMAGKLCYTKVYLKTKAIPHNSKCRYGERGAADAKPKAQIILDAAKVSAASGGNSEPKQGHAECEGLLPPKHDAGTATRHYRAFWQRRCRAAAAGAVLMPLGGNCAVLPKENDGYFANTSRI